MSGNHATSLVVSDLDVAMIYGTFNVEFKVNFTPGVIDTELSDSLCEAELQVRPCPLIKYGVIYSACTTCIEGWGKRE